MKYEMQNLPEKGSTVVVGMSGGVDSTLTSILLQERGCRVIGVTMSMWDGHIPELAADKFHPSCYSPDEEKNIEECRQFCTEHGMEYYVIDVSKEYNQEVLEYFKNEYRNGRTPNPCIKCNRYIKFGAMLEGLKKFNVEYDYFCTGHYAMIVRPDEGVFGTDKRPCMVAGALDYTKDQTYFLYRIPSSVLEKVRFPLAQIKKSEVFELARKAGLKAAEKEESQDFIGSDYFDILFSDKPSVPGNIVDLNGKVLGRHNGIEHYTIGQRRGLGVAVNYPVYVYKIDVENNTVVLAPKSEMSSSVLVADDFVWPADVEPEEAFTGFVKIRLASKPSLATIAPYSPGENDKNEYTGKPWKITFEQPQNAITPGQSVVIYKDNVIIGGGIIKYREE